MFFQGLIGMVVGFLIIIFRVKIKDVTGNIAFAERYLGVGGTWTFLWVLGVLIFILSLMWMLGTLQSFLGDTVGRLFAG